jgi:hypothetical protein
MDDGPQRRRPKPAFHLCGVANVASAESEADDGVDARRDGPWLMPENPESKAERLHRLERVPKEMVLGLVRLVH